MNSIKKYLPYVLIGAVFLGIGTCNYMVNTSTKDNLAKNPKAGHYYVFDSYPEANKEYIMKIKEVRKDSIEFYFPLQELIFGFKQNKSEGTVRDADAKGTMFSNLTITISKSEIKEMIDNDTFNGHMDHKPRITHVFN